jgi:hypothetical protein
MNNEEFARMKELAMRASGIGPEERDVEIAGESRVVQLLFYVTPERILWLCERATKAGSDE